MSKLQSAVAAALCAGLAPAAQALLLTTPASACRPYPAEDPAALAWIRHEPGAVYNADPVNVRRVICPVMRNADANGLTVWIRGAASVNMICTLLSYQVDGALLQAASALSNTNPFAQTFVVGPNQAPPFGHLNAVCGLPPAGRGRLFQLDAAD